MSSSTNDALYAPPAKEATRDSLSASALVKPSTAAAAIEPAREAGAEPTQMKSLLFRVVGALKASYAPFAADSKSDSSPPSDPLSLTVDFQSNTFELSISDDAENPILNQFPNLGATSYSENLSSSSVTSGDTAISESVVNEGL